MRRLGLPWLSKYARDAMTTSRNSSATPHRDYVGFEQRPIRINRNYRIPALPLHLRKRGRSVLPIMMRVMNAITPFMSSVAVSRPRPGVMSDRLSSLNATA